MNWNRLSYVIGLALISLLLSLFSAIVVEASSDKQDDIPSEKIYGPANLLKTWPTPFTTSGKEEDQASSSSLDSIGLTPIAIPSNSKEGARNLLTERFNGPKLFLPPRMVLGQSAEFTIKGSPGAYVAVAMADSNKGAKTVYGRNVRLGADRKLVAIGTIPEQGILSVFIEAPIQGDLVGAPLYFEAAIWTKPDFSDVQIASTVSLIEDKSTGNGVMICAQEDKKERAVVFDVGKSMSMTSVGSLSSGKP